MFLKFINALYFSSRFFSIVGLLVSLFVTSFFITLLLPVSKGLLFLFIGAFTVDLLILFSAPKGVEGKRICGERLSNGDQNSITISLKSFFKFPVSINVIDEIPHQFQVRTMSFDLLLKARENTVIQYNLRPVKRGEYEFGNVNIFVSTVIGLLSRRVVSSASSTVPVFPSFIQMHTYELLAISNKLVDTGIKRIRRIGQNSEFEQIKKYVAGDDIRTINWKATARKSEFMVNNFQDERSQQIYSVIDKGRVMQMPFNGLSLLDYAINASLVISNIAIKKSDRAGLITFQDKVNTVLPASKVNKQISTILEVLYNQRTSFRESDFSSLYSTIRVRISQRSLLFLYTNFETLFSLQRQLPFLKKIAQRHLLVVVFFENTEIKSLIDTSASNLQSVYYKAVAEKFSLEKKMIVRELQKNGIQALLTPPDKLTINAINKYLELKARNMI
jgi:uncharacterized protein (DUF58 family)